MPDDKPVSPEQGQDQLAQKTTQDVSQTQIDQTKSVSTDKSDTNGQPAFDVQTRYDELMKSNKELRAEFTRRSMELSEVKKQLSEMGLTTKQIAEALAKATETRIDPAQFMRDLQEKGPEALESYLEKKWGAKEKAIREEYDKKIKESEHINKELTYNVEEYKRERDSDNYPGWKELIPAMKELCADPTTPIDFKQPAGIVLDALYKLARDRNGDLAVQKAASLARKEAEEAIAKESRTSIATGGKTGTATPKDPRTMSLSDLEQAIGVADRDE